MSPYQKIKKDSFSVTSYTGDGAVLLAFDVDEDKADGLAGFAIHVVTPDKGPYPSNEYWLKNNLGFTADSPGKERSAESNKTPFQTFHWVHFPGAGPGHYTYTVHPCYFEGDGSIGLKDGVSVNVDLSYHSFAKMEVGFTRGYISSQAYADWFKNAKISPDEKSIDFDTAAYEKQYTWLGAHARNILFEFLEECRTDGADLDVFAFDFNEPDMIRQLVKMGSRVRLFQDDSASHKKAGALELDALDVLARAGASVVTGHFGGLAHNKVLIKKQGGKAVKVLTGSANFSLRGLYVQANSILVFDDPAIAGLYGEAFEQAFTDVKHFKSSRIASQWFDSAANGTPPASFSFAPHKAAFPLDTLSDAIHAAKSSVFFAAMNTSGGGPVMPALQGLGDRDGIYSVGVIEDRNNVALFKKGTNISSSVTSKAFLKKAVPEPFLAEWDGGFGKVIHHKFVVCDFNTQSPVVFCGSSNLAKGGETGNGDNLIAVRDPDVATYFAIEAIRLYDHYRFRSAQENSKSSKPLTLDDTDGWTKRYYDPKSLKYYERKLYAAT